ncbi:hypothetical protein ACFXKC_54940 [Streptomyces sp. NPDC059340]|uniref:hypothetical protein n=1 Tax=Streptomyces sp. NPDC059340 TaxID=3346806 RepID=UPI003674E585
MKTGGTWAQLAEAVGKPSAWATAALLGLHPMGKDEAATAAALLELGDDAALAFQLQPPRGALDVAVPMDPTI